MLRPDDAGAKTYFVVAFAGFLSVFLSDFSDFSDFVSDFSAFFSVLSEDVDSAVEVDSEVLDEDDFELERLSFL